MTRDDRTDAPADGASGATGAGHGALHYEIRVEGHLGPRWQAWFDGLSVTTDDDGTTVLAGAVTDQAALHGVLQKLRDLGIPLVSLVPLTRPTTPGPEPRATEGN